MPGSAAWRKSLRLPEMAAADEGQPARASRTAATGGCIAAPGAAARGRTRRALACACAPHSMNTLGRRCSATAADNSVSKHLPSKLGMTAGRPSSTVSEVFSSSTPLPRPGVAGCRDDGAGRPRSRCSSLKMLRRLGGSGCPAGTENARPSACPGPWYGSWPRITTRTCDRRRQRQRAKDLGRVDGRAGGQARVDRADQAAAGVAGRPVAQQRRPVRRGGRLDLARRSARPVGCRRRGASPEQVGQRGARVVRRA